VLNFSRYSFGRRGSFECEEGVPLPANQSTSVPKNVQDADPEWYTQRLVLAAIYSRLAYFACRAGDIATIAETLPRIANGAVET
jgi:hypothetical protein